MYGYHWRGDGAGRGAADWALLAYVFATTLGPMVSVGPVMVVVAEDFVEHRIGLARPEQPEPAVAEG